jgi:DinB superfamily
MTITPDTKSWTWVLERACPECGFDSTEYGFRDVPVLLRENVAAWQAVLERDDVRVRPNESTWSSLEYSAHVRDVFRIFRARLTAMLDQENPDFHNWDQDATAVAERYNEQDPQTVWEQLRTSGNALADAFDNAPDADLARTGRRSDGSIFTVETLARYFIHDPVHHLWDVSHAF